jgi:hypothetical protein
MEIRSRVAGHGGLIYVGVQQIGFVSSAVLGCGILLLRPLSSWVRWTILSLAGLISLSARGFHPLPLHIWEQSFAFILTPVAIIVQVVLLAAGSRDRRPERCQALTRGLLLVGGLLVSTLGTSSLGQLNPTYDAAIFNIDQHLLVRIPSIAMRVADGVPRLYSVAAFAYGNVPAIAALFDALSSRHRRGLSMTVVFLLSAYIGYLCYHIVPSAGPAFLVPAYYHRIWSTGRVLQFGKSVLTVGPQRNCMPSLHATWAYLWLLDIRFIKRTSGRVVIVAAALLTILAALTEGGHWTLDFVVALPFTVSMNALLVQFPYASKLQALIGFVGAIGVAAWFWAILNYSFATLSIDSAWIAVGATSLGSVILFRISSRFDARIPTAGIYQTSIPPST